MASIFSGIFGRTSDPAPETPARSKRWTTGQDGIDKMQLGERDTPKPKEGQVLVKIGAVSLNFRDIEVCSGALRGQDGKQSLHTGGPPPPLVPCSDMCGTVVESRSKLLKKGARVMSILRQSHFTGPVRECDLETTLGFPLEGVLAEYRCFPAECLVPAPEYLSDEEASCLPTASVTAWMGINGERPLGSPQTGKEASPDSKPPPTVLLQGTGGVSVAGLQIAKAAGLRALVTSSSDDRLKRAREDLGADGGVNYRTHWEWQDPVLEMTGNAGADIIFETGGARTLRKSFDCVAFGGLINCVGYLTGTGEEEDRSGGTNKLNVNVLALRRGVTLRGVLNGPRDRFEEVVAFYERHEIRPVVSKTFEMKDAKEAMKYLHEDEHFGKVVIKVA